ncbi:GNAT family N-acetyltransferase [Hirschia baltica]|uniref:GCN5-related N-acetyltransferase n=1 Tax=Hirschia baltica (strain ATCC 49814 / DSM 5838 / IFAM 1418) TaxID=582402 RepID=C6XKU8_HIRBI|nr:GNAT family N-acetyltransferase [Hirschia baltica]ACT59665.1 GCN5-related N-acetyltransferase [Hirschia baltica ATCC 49814]
MLADGFQLGEADPTTDIGRALIAELDAYLLSIYPISVCHRTTPEEILSNGVFYIAKLDEQVVGCGALKENKLGQLELKRMFVRPMARGKGIAKKLLAELETLAQSKGFDAIYLETGPPQKEAIALYENAGYFRRGPFGGYDDHPLSIFMEKRLDSVPSQSNGSAA